MKEPIFSWEKDSFPPAAEGTELRRRRWEWFGKLRLEDKERKLFELESRLKALDRFFNLANLPRSFSEPLLLVNFREEMQIALRGVERVAELSGELLKASARSDYQFEFYVGSRLMGDYERTRWREIRLAQAEPEDSLFILYLGFLNFKDIIRGLVEMEKVPYPVFVNIGSLLSREIVGNRYFSPLRQIEFRPEYDRVENRKIGEIIRSIGEGELQRQVSLVVLAFHRLLQYLQFIHPESEDAAELKESLLFFALILSEAKYLMEFLEHLLPLRLNSPSTSLAQTFLATTDSLAFQLHMELRKIRTGEIHNLSQNSKLPAIKAAVENSHGILKNFFQQSIVQLVQGFAPGVAGEEIFPAFISRREEGLKLREELALLRALMDKFEEITETTEAGTRVETYMKYLLLQQGWIRLFRRETIKYMRYHDRVEFEKYFSWVEQLSPASLRQPDHLDRFKLESKFFKILVETTLGLINQRVDLQDFPLEERQVENRLKRFVASYTRSPQGAAAGKASRVGGKE